MHFHRNGNTIRQHDVIGAERCDQAALGTGDGAVERGGQPLVLLYLESKPAWPAGWIRSATVILEPSSTSSLILALPSDSFHVEDALDVPAMAVGRDNQCGDQGCC